MPYFDRSIILTVVDIERIEFIRLSTDFFSFVKIECTV